MTKPKYQDVNDEVGPVNPNLVAAPLTSKEKRSVGLVLRLTDLDEAHAIEFVRLHEWHISQAPGGAEGLLKQDYPRLLKIEDGR